MLTRLFGGWIGAIAALAACGFAHEEVIDGPYRLVAVDTMDQLRVCYEVDGGCVGRTPEPVRGYGFNDRWISVLLSGHYYVIDRKADSEFAEPGDVVSGPYSAADFDTLSRERDLPSISARVD